MLTTNNEEICKLIVENSPDVIYALGLDEKITFIIPSVELIFGYKPEEVIGKSVKDFLTPEAYQKQSEGMQRALLEKDADVSERLTLQAIKSNGELIWVEIHATFLVDKEENLVGILGIARDVSDRVKNEEDLINRVKALENINKE